LSLFWHVLYTIHKLYKKFVPCLSNRNVYLYSHVENNFHIHCIYLSYKVLNFYMICIVRAIMVVIVWQLDLHLPVQSVPNTTTRVVIVWQLDLQLPVQSGYQVDLAPSRFGTSRSGPSRSGPKSIGPYYKYYVINYANLNIKQKVCSEW
jgi:hypothetical protein